jgi:hypothetical protein
MSESGAARTVLPEPMTPAWTAKDRGAPSGSMTLTRHGSPLSLKKLLIRRRISAGTCQLVPRRRGPDGVCFCAS